MDFATWCLEQTLDGGNYDDLYLSSSTKGVCKTALHTRR